MMRYALLNLLVISIVFVVTLRKNRPLYTRRWLLAAAVLLVMTAIFDSLIIAAGIVAYDPAHFLGIYIGRAPLEDFAYMIAALMVVPYVWKRLGRDE